MNETTRVRPAERMVVSASDRLPAEHVWAAALLFASMGVMCWSRLAVLSQSLWHDEVVTIERYVLAGPAAMFLGDFTVNNHLLFSVLAWGSGELFGHTEAVWRLWSAVPGVATVVVLAAALWRWVSPLAAAIAAVLLTVSPLHHSLAPQARGYGLAFLAASGMVAGSLLAARGGRAGFTVFGVSGWVGIAALPVMVLPFLGHAFALALRPGLRKGTAIAVGMVGAASLAWYLPVFGDLVAATGQEFGQVLPWHGPLTGIWLVLFPLSAEAVGRAGALLAVVGAVAWLVWRGERLLLADFAIPVVLMLTALTAGRLYVADRFMSALVVPLAGLLGVAAADALKRLGRRLRGEAAAGVAVLSSVALLTVFAQYANEVNRVPLENFKQAAQAVRDFDVVLASSARPSGLEHYVGERLQLVAPGEVVSAVCGADPPLAYIEHPFRSEPVDSSCLRALEAVEVVVPQRGRGALLRVWLLEGDRPADDA